MAIIYVLGAADPEMAAIDALLRDAATRVAYALHAGRRVTPGVAYQADGVSAPIGDEDDVVLVECGGPALDVCRHCGGIASGIGDGLTVADAGTPGGLGPCGDCHIFGGRPGPGPVRCDHHRPGDPGYGRPPADYFAASSLGQVLRHLAATHHPAVAARLDDAVFVAAADHCLAAAYRGECPGVDPDALMRWRVDSRAAHQGRTAEAVLADVEAARAILRDAVWHRGDEGKVRLPWADLRGRYVPELPEAAAREGIPFVADAFSEDGRRKIVLQCAPPDLVARFLAGALIPGLVDLYGDPARGFAGGYIPAQS